MCLFLMFLLVLTMYNPSIFGLNLSNYVLISAFLLSLFFERKKLHKLRMNQLNYFIAMFYIWIVVSNIFSVNHIVTIENTIKITMLIIFGFFLDLAIKNKKDEYKMWNFIIIGNVVSCVFGLYQLIFKTSTYHLAYGTVYDALRVVGAFPTPNIYANFMSLSMPIILLRALKEKRIIWFGILVANAVVLYESYSRGSMLALAIAFVIWKIVDSVFITRSIVITKKKIYFIMPAVIALGMVIRRLIVSGKLMFLFQTRSSNSIRVNSILKALQVFSGNPLGQGFGVGIGDILDGTYINVLVDLGILGIIIFFILIVAMISRSIKICKRENDIYTQATLLTILILALLCVFENIIYDSLLNFFIAIIWYELNFYKPKSFGTSVECVRLEQKIRFENSFRDRTIS